MHTELNYDSELEGLLTILANRPKIDFYVCGLNPNKKFLAATQLLYVGNELLSLNFKLILVYLWSPDLFKLFHISRVLSLASRVSSVISLTSISFEIARERI